MTTTSALAHATWTLGQLIHDHPDLPVGSVVLGVDPLDGEPSISVRAPQPGDVHAWGRALDSTPTVGDDGSTRVRGTVHGVVVRAWWHAPSEAYHAEVRALRAERDRASR